LLSSDRRQKYVVVVTDVAQRAPVIGYQAWCGFPHVSADDERGFRSAVDARGRVHGPAGPGARDA
jgi:hypothetical protein